MRGCIRESFMLVRYLEDGILQVVPKVKKRGNSYVAKYNDGRYYEVDILLRNSSRLLLENLCTNIKKNVPKVILQRCHTEEIENEREIDRYENEKEIPFQGIVEEAMLTKSEKEVPAESDSPGFQPTKYLEDEEIGTNYANNTYQASQILAEAVRQNIIILSDELLIPEYTPDIEIMWGDASEASNSLPEAFTPAPEEMLHKIANGPSNQIQRTGESTKNHIDHDIQKFKRAPQKKHCCFFCQKLLLKIYRHYTTVHKTEKEVREIIVLPVKSEHRKLLLNKLRKKGDYVFNTTLKNENQSDILCRGTLKDGHETLREKNVPCPHCLGYYSKLSIRHHVKNCMPMGANKKRLNIQAECRKLLKNIHAKASEDLKIRIFPYFNDDEVSNIIRYDEAVIAYGNYMCRKYTTEHHAQQIRSNLRAFGRLILALREINPNIKELSDVLDPIYIELIISAIDKVAVLDKSSHHYKAPATAMLLATELKRLCKLLTMEYARNRDKEGQKRMEDLLLTFNLEFQVTVNKRGLETQKINKRRKKIILPKTEHIAEFRIYLEGRIRYFIEKLERSFCQKAWVHLTEYTLVHLAVFNRKRPGETQRILVDDYKNCEIIEEDDLSDHTDAISREQAKKWARVRLTGKLGKDTALLVHRDLGFKAIDLILKYREKAGVNPENRYLFGEPSETLIQNTFQACQLIRKLSYESEIENPELLRTRLLRQQLATEAAQSNIDQRLEGRVSDFMSHQRRIHEDYYVMTQKTDDITKVSRLLENYSSVDKNGTDKKAKSGGHLKYSQTVSSNDSERNVPGGNNKNYEKTSQPRQKRKDLSSDEEYFPEQSQHSVTQAEMNFIMGKKQTRRSWSSSEKNKAREYFYDEIFYGDMIQRQKIKGFFESNKELYKYRTPHLIMQWIRGQRNEVLAKETGNQAKRIRWSTPEKEVLRSSTERHSAEGTTPTITECELIFEKNKNILKNRNPNSVKSFIYNEITKRHDHNVI